jgi:hypothetical protein
MQNITSNKDLTNWKTSDLKNQVLEIDFRLVKSQREAKQRPSYTIAVRIR